MTQETIFDKRPTPSRYDRVGANTLLEEQERERTELRAYLEFRTILGDDNYDNK